MPLLPDPDWYSTHPDDETTIYQFEYFYGGEWTKAAEAFATLDRAPEILSNLVSHPLYHGYEHWRLARITIQSQQDALDWPLTDP